MRRHPKPPSVAPPIGAGHEERSRVENELNQLRQRGLAKIFNRHFTNVAQTLAAEKAAADAALRDLEARKARMRDLPSNPGEMSILDNMYVELQQRKADCKRKEKETLLLYQRYVDKFGNTGGVAVPKVKTPQSTSKRSGEKRRVPRAPNSPGLPQYPPVASPSRKAAASPIDYTSGPHVPHLAQGIEDGLQRHVQRGGERHPSIKNLGVEQTFQSERAMADQESRAHFIRSLEGKGIDARATPSPQTGKAMFTGADRNGLPDTPDVVASTPQVMSSYGESTMGEAKGHASSAAGDAKTSSTEVPGLEEEMSPAAPVKSTESGLTLPTTDGTTDDGSVLSDDRSLMSGLTDVNSMVVNEAEIKLLEFLKSETDAIRKMIDIDDMSVRSTASMSEIGSESVRAAEIAENMVKKMQTMLDDFKAETNKLETSNSREPYPLKTMDPNEKWMVHWDETHQREYYYNTKTGTSQWDKPACAIPSSRSATSPDDYAPIADYTKTSKSRSALSHYDVMPEQRRLGTRHVSSRRLEYRKLQRRRRNRRRVILAAVTAASAIALGFGYHKYRSNPEVLGGASSIFNMTRVEYVIQRTFTFIPGATKNNDAEIRAREAAELAERKAREEAELAELRAREEAERLKKELEAHRLKEKQEKKERERLALLEEAARRDRERKERERRLREEAEKRAKEEAEKRALLEKERIRKAKELKERQQREREERLVREREEADRRAAEEELSRKARHRPWHCNVPLLYVVNGHCRRVSSHTPAFDLKSLVEHMLQ